MEIKTLSDFDRARWDAYVDNHPEATFFHKSGWKGVLEQAFQHSGHYLYAERQGEIVGVLPLAHVKSLIFSNSLTSLPFCESAGVLSDSLEVKASLLAEASRLARTLNVDFLELRHREQKQAEWPCKSDLYVNFSREIDPDPDVNMKNIPRKQRAMVRKGIKAELQTEVDSSIDRFYDVYAYSVHSLGTPVFPKKYFKLLLNEFGDCSSILTVTKEGQVVASVFSFYFRDTVLPYYGGGYGLARQYKGYDFMYWQLMVDAAEKGYRVFDYGRSKVGTGSYSFKKNWGFEPKPLYYEYDLVKSENVPDINPLNPKYRIFINTWKKMPLWSTKIIGPHLIKNLS